MRLEDELKEMILRELKIEDMTPDDLADDAPLFDEGLGLDSLDAVELVILLKKHYQIDISEMEVAQEAFASISTLSDHIRKHGSVTENG